MKAAMYSMRPCPKGWSSSAFFPAIFEPTTEITELPASDRLLKPSAMIDTELMMMPREILNTKRSRLHTIPVRPALSDIFVRSVCSFIFASVNSSNRLMLRLMSPPSLTRRCAIARRGSMHCCPSADCRYIKTPVSVLES